MAITVTAKQVSSPNPQVGTTGDTDTTLAEIKQYLIFNSILVAALIEDVQKLADEVNTLP